MIQAYTVRLFFAFGNPSIPIIGIPVIDGAGPAINPENPTASGKAVGPIRFKA